MLVPNTGHRGAGRLTLGGGAVALFTWWAAAGGGYAPTRWYPGALLVLVALAVLARPAAVRALEPPARWALAGLAAFTAWSLISIAWSAQRGVAWDGANRTLLYLTVFALFATQAWRACEAAAILGLYSAAIAALGAAVLLGAVDPADAFDEGRLAAPVGYANGTAALFLAAGCPAVVLASRREIAWPLRAFLLAVAGALLQLAILAQSRGSFVAVGAAALAWLALVRDRRRAVTALLPIAAVTAATLPVLLAVYHAGDLEQAVRRERVAFAASFALLAAAGAVAARLEAAARRPPGLRHRRAPARLLPVAVAVVVLGTVALAAASPPGRGGTDTGRYGFWRVAAQEFVHHPLHGVGADTFALDYVRDRRGPGEEPLYPHSLVWRTLAQAGLLGTACFAIFLASIALDARRLRRAEGLRAAAAAAGLVAAAAWLGHATVDWLWELPAVTAPAMAWLGLAVAPAAVPASRKPRAIPVAFAGGAVAAAALSYALPLMAARLVERAARTGADDPQAALRDLDRARDLNGFSPIPDLVAASIALRAGDRQAARRAFERAAGREPRDWYAPLQLAVLDLDAGRRAAALRRLRGARARNPFEPAIAIALDAGRAGTTIPAALRDRLAAMAVQGPLGRHSIDCRPVLGVAARCRARDRG